MTSVGWLDRSDLIGIPDYDILDSWMRRDFSLDLTSLSCQSYRLRCEWDVKQIVRLIQFRLVPSYCSDILLSHTAYACFSLVFALLTGAIEIILTSDSEDSGFSWLYINMTNQRHAKEKITIELQGSMTKLKWNTLVEWFDSISDQIHIILILLDEFDLKNK